MSPRIMWVTIFFNITSLSLAGPTSREEGGNIGDSGFYVSKLKGLLIIDQKE